MPFNVEIIGIYRFSVCFCRLSLLVMARRQVGSTRRLGDGGSFPFAGALHSKSRSSPLLSICLVLVVYFS